LPSTGIQTDFGVGANIHGNHRRMIFPPGNHLPQTAANQHGNMVRTDKPGNVGRQIHTGIGGKMQTNVFGGEFQRTHHRRDIGCHAQLAHRQAAEQMVNHGISHCRHPED